MFNDSNQKNSIDKDIEKDGLKVDGNILQVLSDIQEVTEEFSSTLLVRDDGSSESTIGRYQGFFKLVTRIKIGMMFCDICTSIIFLSISQVLTKYLVSM